MNQGEFGQGPQRRAGEGPAVFLSPRHPTWDFFLDERLSTSVRISSPGLSAGDKSSCLPEAPSKAGGADKRLCVAGTELACLEVGHPHRHPSGQPGEDSCNLLQRPPPLQRFPHAGGMKALALLVHPAAPALET